MSTVERELIPPKPRLGETTSFRGLCRGAWGAQGRSLGTLVQACGYLKAAAATESLSQWTEDPGKHIFEAVQVAGSFSEVSPLRLLLAQAWEWAS